MVKLVLVALSVVLATAGFAVQPVVAALNSGDALCVKNPPAASGTKILTLGDSLTVGAVGDYTWRYFLWKRLINNGGVNMVGSFNSVVDPVTIKWGSKDYVCPFDSDTFAVPGTSLEKYLGKKIAQDGGYYTTSQSSLVKSQVMAQKPQVLIVFAGINDLTLAKGETTSRTPDQVLTYAKKVVTEARAASPKIKILFATVSSYATDTPYTVPAKTRKKLSDYNTLLTAGVKRWTTTKSPVRLVKTVQKWGKLDLTYDGLHPNVQGEEQIAHDFAVALRGLGIGPAAAATPNRKSYLGLRTAPVLNSAKISGSNVVLKWTMAPGSVRTRIERKVGILGGGSWTTIGEKGLIDAPVCTDDAGVAVTAGGAHPAPYHCTWTDTDRKSNSTYRLSAGRGLAGIRAQNPNDPSQLFLYSASVRSNTLAPSS